MKKITFIVAITLVLAGCAVNARPYVYSDQEKRALKPILCKDKTECDVLWQKTQFWIANNSGYRIQTANDVLIQTYGPLQDSTGLAMTVTKEPDGKGGASIAMRIYCGNQWLGCYTSPITAMVVFHKYVSGE